MTKTFIILSFISILFVGCVGKDSMKKEHIRRIEVSSLSSKEEADIAKAFGAGAFDLSTYQEAQQFIQDRLENKIRFTDFSKQDMYATEEKVAKSDDLIKITELHDKNDIQQHILYAARDNRVIYTTAAFSQGDTLLLSGMLITIIPKYNEDGKLIGKANYGRQVFIPNF